MKEYIEREAAINAGWSALYKYEDETEKRFMDEPELKIDDWFIHRIFVQGMHSKYQETLLQLPAAEVRGVKPAHWISVEDRLPEDGEEVLCYYEYFRYGSFNRMKKTIDRGYFLNGHFGGEPTSGMKARVLYWMPLPEPPKEET